MPQFILFLVVPIVCWLILLLKGRFSYFLLNLAAAGSMLVLFMVFLIDYRLQGLITLVSLSFVPLTLVGLILYYFNHSKNSKISLFSYCVMGVGVMSTIMTGSLLLGLLAQPF